MERLSFKICRAGTALLLSHFLAGATLCTDVTGVLDKPQPGLDRSLGILLKQLLPGHPCSGYRASREFTWVGRALWLCGVTSHKEKGDAAGRALISSLTWHRLVPSLQDAGLRTSVGLANTTWESGPDFLDFSVSENFLNSLTALSLFQKSPPGIATVSVPRASWGNTGWHLQWLRDGSGPMAAPSCQQTAQHLLGVGRASLSASASQDNSVFTGIVPPPRGAALPNFRSQVPGSVYLGLLFQKTRKNWYHHCVLTLNTSLVIEQLIV